MVDKKTGNLLDAFRTQSAKKQITEPKALSSGQMKPKKSVKRKVRNAMVKIYVNGALLVISASLVFVAYRLAVIPQLFPPEASADDKTEQQQQVQVDQTDYQGAAQYAITFAYLWLQGNLEQAQRYTANGYQFPENVLSPSQKTVNWTKVYEVTPVGENKVNILYQASVQEGGNNNGDDSSDSNNQESSASTVYLSVPLMVEDGKYGVYDIPTFVPGPGQAIYKQEERVNTPIPKAEQQKVRQRVELFLSEYLGGETAKTSVYFQDAQPRSTLDGQLNGIHEVQLYQAKAGDNNRVLVDVIADTTINGSQMLQKFQFTMLKNGNVWNIEKSTPELPINNTQQQE